MRVLVARGIHREVTILDAEGTPTDILRWGWERSELTDSDWEHFRATYSDFLDRNPEERPLVPPLRFYPRPDFKPAFSEAMVASDGTMWFQVYGAYGPFDVADSGVWEALRPDGSWLYSLSLPPSIRLLNVRRNELLGLVRDELGRESIGLWSLE
jgi:hypothetical protein